MSEKKVISSLTLEDFDMEGWTDPPTPWRMVPGDGSGPALAENFDYQLLANPDGSLELHRRYAGGRTELVSKFDDIKVSDETISITVENCGPPTLYINGISAELIRECLSILKREMARHGALSKLPSDGALQNAVFKIIEHVKADGALLMGASDDE